MLGLLSQWMKKRWLHRHFAPAAAAEPSLIRVKKDEPHPDAPFTAMAREDFLRRSGLKMFESGFHVPGPRRLTDAEQPWLECWFNIDRPTGRTVIEAGYRMINSAGETAEKAPNLYFEAIITDGEQQKSWGSTVVPLAPKTALPPEEQRVFITALYRMHGEVREDLPLTWGRVNECLHEYRRRAQQVSLYTHREQSHPAF